MLRSRDFPRGSPVLQGKGLPRGHLVQPPRMHSLPGERARAGSTCSIRLLANMTRWVPCPTCTMPCTSRCPMQAVISKHRYPSCPHNTQRQPSTSTRPFHHPPLHLQLNNALSLGQHWVWKRMTVKWSGARPGHQVLDVCCGSGDIAQLLAAVVGPQGKVRVGGGEGTAAHFA